MDKVQTFILMGMDKSLRERFVAGLKGPNIIEVQTIKDQERVLNLPVRSEPNFSLPTIVQGFKFQNIQGFQKKIPLYKPFKVASFLHPLILEQPAPPKVCPQIYFLLFHRSVTDMLDVVSSLVIVCKTFFLCTNSPGLL